MLQTLFLHVTIFNGCRMKHSCDVATGILLFMSRCCDAFKYMFFILQKLIFYVATVCFRCSTGASNKKIIGRPDVSKAEKSILFFF